MVEANRLGRKTGIRKDHGQNVIFALNRVDEDVQTILDNSDSIRAVAKETMYANNFLYLGRGINFPGGFNKGFNKGIWAGELIFLVDLTKESGPEN